MTIDCKKKLKCYRFVIKMITLKYDPCTSMEIAICDRNVKMRCHIKKIRRHQMIHNNNIKKIKLFSRHLTK